MSRDPVTKVVFTYISAEGNCIYCGAHLKICSVCGQWFKAGNIRNLVCSARCRTRKHRQRIREQLELDDE